MIKLFTHNDLDGIGCALLACLVYGQEEVAFETCGYDFINDKLTEYIEEKNFENFTRCYITDISMNEEVATKISTLVSPRNEISASIQNHFQLLDHHTTATFLNATSWAKVQLQTEDDTLCCGTSLFYDYLKWQEPQALALLNKPLIIEFVEKIRRYDTWDWTRLEDLEAKQLNDLYYLLGKERFMAYWLERLSKGQGTFDYDATHKLILEMRQNEIDKYIEARNEDLTIQRILSYEAGIVFADRFQSELGNKLAELHPELDFIAMININGGVSCRTNKDTIHLGEEVAKVFGGGGHAKAAGLPVTDTIRQLVVEAIFKQ
ncbi:oligoribonuclease [Sporanaerobium hydrogeniformans]|uniref:Oligoribonuclease n=1 Tax=Sporanaerobium hydrogeniformans TaxID=3072179 RepID=A0AC61DDP9_9FIRM|nr:oligoribonuclease [Sporanaerobium hydrogeniformans]PHV70826.1 oligoribonuclease [Sporanaerobium hydrogeniformans]